MRVPLGTGLTSRGQWHLLEEELDGDSRAGGKWEHTMLGSERKVEDGTIRAV